MKDIVTWVICFHMFKQYIVHNTQYIIVIVHIMYIVHDFMYNTYIHLCIYLRCVAARAAKGPQIAKLSKGFAGSLHGHG